MSVKEIDIAILQLKEQQNKLLNELSFLVGISSMALEELALEAKALEYYPGSVDSVYQAVLAENYDLQLGLVYIEAKKKLVELAKVQANGLPDLGLHLEVSYSGPRFPFIETDWARKDDWQLTMSIATMGNILGNPVKKADAQKAASELGEAEAKLEEGRKNLLSFVQTSWGNTQLIKARLEYNLLKQQVSIEELGAKKFTISVGSGSEAELLNALVKALSGLADAYTLCINYRTELLSLDLVQGK
jgi:outer membrane protein TolC